MEVLDGEFRETDSVNSFSSRLSLLLSRTRGDAGLALTCFEDEIMTYPVINFCAAAWKPLVLASAISALFVPPVYAADDELKTLSPVVVTASRLEQPQTEALPHTTVISSEQIRESGASDVISLLNRQAGIEILQSGGSGMQSSLFMRGAEASQHLILIDGIPVRDATMLGMAAPLQHILPEHIERIEIVRGNVSAIYGSGAIGGVIQIFTKRGTGSPSVNLSAEAGSRGTTRLGAGVSGQSGNTRYALSMARFKTDGFSAVDTSQFPSENPDDDGDKNLSLTTALSHEWQKGHELGVRAYFHDAEFDYDNFGDGPVTRIDDGTSRQHTVALFSKNRLSAKWLSTVTLSETEITRSDKGVDAGTVLSDSNYKSRARLLQWENELSLSPDWVLTGGLSAAKERATITSYFSWPESAWGPAGSSSSGYSPSRSNRSMFAGLNGKSDAHSMQLNVRYDDVGDSGSDATGYLGYGYALTPKWKFIASASTAFLAPNLYQLYDPSFGNPELKAERALTHEFGFQYATGPTLLRTTVFSSRTRDLIIWNGSGYSNIGKARNHGLELSASSHVAGFDVHASLTLQNPKNKVTGERLLRRAKTLGSLALSKGVGDWRFGGDVQYAGLRKDGAADMPSYWLANLNVHYVLDKTVTLYGRMENLFDRDYQTVYGYNQPSRGIFVGIRWNQ